MTLPDLTFIDLFSGCGGLSLGLQQAGFSELASIDFDAEAIAVFRANFPNVSHILQRDLKKYKPEQLSQLIGTNHIDLLVGGPPCQGFSLVRQVDGANSGVRLIEDDRRNLYQEYLKYVDFFKPKIFVMENVLGIKSAVGGLFFTQVQTEARQLGYRVHGEEIRSWEFGVPQKRKRQLIIGTLLDLPLFSTDIYMLPTHGNQDGLLPLVTLWEAIGDLPDLSSGDGKETSNYDMIKQQAHVMKYGGRYFYDVLEVGKTKQLTAHRSRKHSERDLRDFKRLHEGESSAHALKQGREMEFPYKRETFKDRYTRQHRHKLCSTIVAHLSKDGLMFIHPTQDRSLTPREAARIQSFPDWFQFPVSQTHQFRLIGNAVPPLVGKCLGNAINLWFDEIMQFPQKINNNKFPINDLLAISWLQDLLNSNEKSKMDEIPEFIFKCGWFGIAYFFCHLHPDSASENGNLTYENTQGIAPVLAKTFPKYINPVYARSGWPINLVPYVKEARRRFDTGELTEEEYYCSAVFVNGLQSKRGQYK
jgi:DNA (cytosine-5)-methyltransferase 1